MPLWNADRAAGRAAGGGLDQAPGRGAGRAAGRGLDQAPGRAAGSLHAAAGGPDAAAGGPGVAPGRLGAGPRGMSLVEVLVAGFLLMLGMSVSMELSNVAQKTRKRAQVAAAADRLAQELLSQAVLENCISELGQGVCKNLTDKDATAFPVWIKPGGVKAYAAPAPGEGAWAFEARFDVQSAGGCAVGASRVHCAATVDAASAWGIDRPLFEGQAGNLHNVRITVSYADPFNGRVRFVSYQSRAAP